jgi:hypothetical protein
VADSSAVGVPVIWPVVVESVSPAGSVGETAKDKVPKPPDAVTGVTGVMAVPTVTVVVATACVVISVGALKASENVFADVCAVGVV